MTKVFIILFTFCFLISCHLFGSNLSIENVRAVDRDDVISSPVSVIFDIKWNNSWHNDKNHDAVWVFMKFNGYWDNQVKILPEGHRILNNRSGIVAHPKIDVSKDSLGFMIYPDKNYRGDVSYKLQILLDTTHQNVSWNKITGMKVHGVEMVFIPEGPFTLGNPDDAAIKRASFYKSDSNGKADGLVTITSEDAIDVGPQEGALYYWSEEALYNGDQSGPVPSEFPKGHSAFYVMKYELTQGQYAAFLNSIPTNWTYTRSPISGRDYYEKRGSIRLINGIYVADNFNRPMNYISFTDGLAYTDWAALRPITELEYEKAARGPSTPIAAGFVWGNNTYDLLERYVTSEGEIALANGYDESQLTEENRAVFGASYYWVMDLSGSLWEKVITIGNATGRTFKGSHGDGVLDFGSATNEDWPKSDNELGGFGYRGGGYYQVGTTYSDFNPHSPVGYRYYGAWSGGPRYISYGFRAGRSAN